MIDASATASKLEIVSISYPPQRKAGQIVEGDTPEAKAQKVIELLNTEAKVL